MARKFEKISKIDISLSGILGRNLSYKNLKAKQDCW